MADSIPDDLRDPQTPDDVIISLEPRVPDFDPTLGIAVAKVDRRGKPRHRLVTIGDSLTHGFQSGAIFNTKIAWPMLVAWEMGWDDSMRYPTYEGFGGLPINIEYLVRDLGRRFGEKISWWESAFAAMRLRDTMAKIENWWERGPGSVVPRVTGIMHNLAVYGWDLRDALEQTADTLHAAIQKPKDNFFSQIVENANQRAALRVYESARDGKGAALTAFEAAQRLGDEPGEPEKDGSTSPHGIETLVVALGANNALASVTSLKVKWSGEGFDDIARKGAYTVWRPTHFEAELKRVVAAVRKIKARHVIFANVPHVTIPPITRGVGAKVRPGSRYFPYYTRPWITDEQFNAKDDPNITENHARAIDSAIDQYNDAIAAQVRAARKAGLDWYLLDVAALLDRLASRRYIDSPAARPDWWTPYELPPALAALNPVPTSRFFTSDRSGRTQGGLFSLDGVHPTTIGYGIMAQEFINVMQRAGVTFVLGDGQTERTGAVAVDFNRVIALDSLISDPPIALAGAVKSIGWIDQTVDVFGRINPFG